MTEMTDMPDAPEPSSSDVHGVGGPRVIPGSGDGWSAGPNGSTVWGRCGAAGLFLVASAHDEVLLQHRAAWTSAGDTWGIPGGARDMGETAAEAAIRESIEECSIDPELLEVLDVVVTAGPFAADPARSELPGDWTYTTVIARTTSGNRISTVPNEESYELRWVRFDAVEALDLLPAFRSAFPKLRRRAEELHRRN